MKTRRWRVFRGAASIALRPRTQCEPLRPARSRPQANDAVSGHGISRIARDGSLQQPCFAALCYVRRCAMCAGVADRERRWSKHRRRREGDSGQNAEPTPSARTNPGPSAMALTSRCRRRVLPRRAPGPQRGSRVGVAILICGTGAHGQAPDVRTYREVADLKGCAAVWKPACTIVTTYDDLSHPPPSCQRGRLWVDCRLRY